LRTEIEIEATTGKVWQTLTDLNQYAQCSVANFQRRSFLWLPQQPQKFWLQGQMDLSD
jgi:hypothetical protein